MAPFRKMVLPLMGALVVTGVVFSRHEARTRPSPPPLIGEEMRRVQSEFAAGGIRRLSANWYACIDRARASQDANAAERCIVYGYAALLLGDTGGAAARTSRMRHLTPDGVAPGQNEMLSVMGIPEGPRQAWLDRYRRWVADDYTPDISAADTDTADIGAPDTGTAHDGARGNQKGQTDLATVADGKYPLDALREPGIADEVRQLAGPSVFARLRDYSFGSPMEFTGRYTIGMACEPRACGVSEARYVISTDNVWIAIVDGGRTRIYGNPPSQVRALLLRDQTQAAWRGAVESMAGPGPPPAIQASAGAVAGGPPLRPPLRMSISPHPIPVSADPVPRGQPDGGTSEIRLRNHGGNLEVPVTINGAMTLPFATDSGASDVSVSAQVMEKLIQSGTVSRADLLGPQIYRLADGSAVSSETFRIHLLKVGDREVRDVMGSVSNDSDTMLLGQSFLTRFRSWSIDNQRQVLSLK